MGEMVPLRIGRLLYIWMTFYQPPPRFSQGSGTLKGRLPLRLCQEAENNSAPLFRALLEGVLGEPMPSSYMGLPGNSFA